MTQGKLAIKYACSSLSFMGVMIAIGYYISQLKDGSVATCSNKNQKDWYIILAINLGAMICLLVCLIIIVKLVWMLE